MMSVCERECTISVCECEFDGVYSKVDVECLKRELCLEGFVLCLWRERIMLGKLCSLPPHTNDPVRMNFRFFFIFLVTLDSSAHLDPQLFSRSPTMER